MVGVAHEPSISGAAAAIDVAPPAAGAAAAAAAAGTPALATAAGGASHGVIHWSAATVAATLALFIFAGLAGALRVPAAGRREPRGRPSQRLPSTRTPTTPPPHTHHTPTAHPPHTHHTHTTHTHTHCPPLPEIGGGWLVWQGVRNKKPWWWIAAGEGARACSAPPAGHGLRPRSERACCAHVGAAPFTPWHPRPAPTTPRPRRTPARSPLPRPAGQALSCCAHTG